MFNENRFARGVLPLFLKLLLGVLIVSVWVIQAHGVENVSQITWGPSLAVTPSGQTSTLKVSFDADLSPLDLCCATTSFSIAVLHPKGNPDVLFRFVCGPMPRGVPAGTKAHFALEYDVGCSSEGEVRLGSPRNASVSYVHPYFGAQVQGLRSEHVNVHVGMGEIIRFVVLDQNALPLRAAQSPNFGCDSQFGSDVNGSIGVYFDALGTLCQGTIPAGTTGKIYIVAHLDGATAEGIAGAEFRFTGLPDSWEAHPVPNPDILAMGDPFGSGVVLGFVCQPPVEGTVVLYEVLVIANDDVPDVEFQIESRDPPLNNPCPLLLQCDDPAFTAYCVEGLPCFVNYTTPTTCERPIPLGLAEATWSTVKELYR